MKTRCNTAAVQNRLKSTPLGARLNPSPLEPPPRRRVTRRGAKSLERLVVNAWRSARAPRRLHDQTAVN